MILLSFLILYPVYLCASVIRKTFLSTSFKKESDILPCMWYDGFITNINDQIHITTNKNSSVLVVSKEEEIFRSIKQPVSLALENTASKVFIITDKEGESKSSDDHDKELSLIMSRRIEFESVPGEDYEVHSVNVAYMEIEPLLGLIANSSLNTSEKSSRHPITQVNDKDDTGDEVADAMNQNTQSDEMSDEDSSSESSKTETEQVTAEALSVGKLLKHADFTVPYIIVRRETKCIVVINSQTGQRHRFRECKLKPYPKQTLKYDPILNYKHMYPGSQVWYLSKKEKILYLCIYLRATLDGSDIECKEKGIVEDLYWDEIYPKDAYKYIKHEASQIIGGEFSVEKCPKSRRKCKGQDLRQFRSSVVKNMKNKSVSPSVTEFHEGMQLKYDTNEAPFIYLSKLAVGQINLICSSTGVVHRIRSTVLLSPMPKENMIPEETNMIPGKDYKFIMPGSFVLYLHSDNILYPCVVSALSYGKKPRICCVVKFKYLMVNWDQLFPIKAYSLVKDKGPIWGSKEGEEITVDYLRSQIKDIQYRKPTKK